MIRKPDTGDTVRSETWNKIPQQVFALLNCLRNNLSMQM